MEQWVPVSESKFLSQEQRDALDALILTMVGAGTPTGRNGDSEEELDVSKDDTELTRAERLAARREMERLAQQAIDTVQGEYEQSVNALLKAAFNEDIAKRRSQF